MIDHDPRLWPNTLYRYVGGERQGMTFKTPADVPEGEGWVSLDYLGDPPVARKPKPEPMPLADAADAGKRLVRAESENTRLKDTLKYIEDENDALKRENGALRESLALAEALIPKEEGEAAPKPKPRRKPRSS